MVASLETYSLKKDTRNIDFDRADLVKSDDGPRTNLHEPMLKCQDSFLPGGDETLSYRCIPKNSSFPPKKS